MRYSSCYVWHFGLIWILSCVSQARSSSDIVTKKPDFIQTCKIYEPHFTKCSTESIQGLMSAVTKEPGVPEINKAVGSLDPLMLEKIYFKQDHNDAANLRATLTNIVATGLLQMVVKESKVSKKDFSWRTKIFLPKFKLDGHYKMDGRILLLPLNGEGRFIIDIDGMDITMHTKTILFERDNFTFYNVTEVRADLDIKKLRTYFYDLFGGSNKELEKTTNESFNQNWREFFEALRPLITNTVEKIMYDIMHKLFLIYPANFFVSDIPTSEKLYGQNKTS